MEILGQGGVVTVEEVDFKGVLEVVFGVLVQVVLSCHQVAHVPVDFPLSENWEAQLVDHFHLAVGTFGIGATDISDVIVIVKSMNVFWEVNRKVGHSVLALIWVDVRHVVNSGELTVDTSSQVEEVEVLIN